MQFIEKLHCHLFDSLTQILPDVIEIWANKFAGAGKSIPGDQQEEKAVLFVAYNTVATNTIELLSFLDERYLPSVSEDCIIILAGAYPPCSLQDGNPVIPACAGQSTPFYNTSAGH